MGKYIQKQSPKSAGDVVPMETGVLTRAKARALQKSASAQDGSYIQLRSRRLERVPIPVRKRTQRVNRRKKGIDKNVPDSMVNSELGENGVSVDGPIGENLDRSSRETTPVSLIRDPNVIRSPGPWTRPVRRPLVHKPAIIPNFSPVPEAFAQAFAESVEQQKQEFIKKYNFDPVKEVPLPGRFEWEKVDLKPKA